MPQFFRHTIVQLYTPFNRRKQLKKEQQETRFTIFFCFLGTFTANNTSVLSETDTGLRIWPKGNDPLSIHENLIKLSKNKSFKKNLMEGMIF